MSKVRLNKKLQVAIKYWDIALVPEKETPGYKGGHRTVYADWQKSNKDVKFLRSYKKVYCEDENYLSDVYFIRLLDGKKWYRIEIWYRADAKADELLLNKDRVVTEEEMEMEKANPKGEVIYN